MDANTDALGDPDADGVADGATELAAGVGGTVTVGVLQPARSTMATSQAARGIATPHRGIGEGL